MCLAIPGKIISVKNKQAVVDFEGAHKEINLALVDAKAGDWVVVHAGFVIEKMDKKTASKILKAYEQ